ncbi:hypothetical protein MRX96_034503 [Rhipicephalus microplus]
MSGEQPLPLPRMQEAMPPFLPESLPTARRRAFSTADSNDWTTINPANPAAVTADDFPNCTNLADKTNAI